MMEPSDWIAGLVGAVVFCLGLFPLLGAIGKGPAWFAFQLPVALLAWIVMIGGFYLIVNAIIEITNSNILGWITGVVALIITVTGVLSVLGKAGKITGFFAMSWISPIFYYVIFVILGIFLMIATFARKL